MSIKMPSTNPKYRLTYFNFKALAEPIRFMFAYGGIEYEDVRLTWSEWKKYKPTTPMGQIPVLEVDGIRLYQSTSIARYIAKHVGLAGSNDWENLLIDTAVDVVNDLRLKMGVVYYERDENVKEIKFGPLKSDIVPYYLDKLEILAKENNGHLALNKLTWADFYFAGVLDYLKHMMQYNLLENYPTLQALVEDVYSLEPISAWIAKRPDSEL